ncbi:MAG TPA: phage tail tape measure protein, partial [Vicinamibacterales bacterium]|nr:phage tail tape measure protein [Vicinamibacterales bacterium]
MSRVKALTGATTEAMAALSAQAQDLGMKTEHTATNAAEAMSAFALAGFETREIFEAMPATLALASAGQISVGEAAGIAAQLMAGMGLTADELGGAVDVMAKAFTSSNQTIGDLGEAMKVIGPVARTAGFGLKEITASIMATSDAGIRGSEAGSGLRRVILGLAGPSSEAAGTMKKLGLNVADAQGDMRPLVDIIGDLGKAMKGMGTAEKLDVLNTLFGKRGATVAATLINTGAEAIRGMEEQLNDAGGTAQRIAETQLDNLAGSWTRMKSAAEAAGIVIFESMGGKLRAVVDKATGAIRGFIGFWRTSMAVAEFVIENWRDVVLLAYTKAQLGLVQLAAATAHLLTVRMPSILSWFAENWRGMFVTLGKNALTAMKNI